MRALGFREIQTMECLLREYNIQTTTMPVANLGFDAFDEITPGSGPINNTNAGTIEPQVGMVQKAWESWRRKRPYQRDTRNKDDDGKKRAKQGKEDEAEDESGDNEDEDTTNKDKAEDIEMAEIEGEHVSENKNGDEKSSKESESTKDDTKGNGNHQKCVYTCKSAAPKLVIPGHTGYLMFATLFPEFTT